MYFYGSQPLWHMLLTGIAPLMALTILPVTLILIAPLSAAQRADLGFLAFFNIGISGGDLVNFLWLSTRLPLHAIVMGNGWGMVWKDSKPEDI